MTRRSILETLATGSTGNPLLQIPLPSLADPECAVEAAWAGDTVMVLIQGTVDARNAEEFGARMVLLRQHLDKARARLAAVRVDIQNLYFLNSWGLKAFVSWVTEPYDKTYPIVIVLNPGSHWQRRSFQSIAALGSGRVSLEVSR